MVDYTVYPLDIMLAYVSCGIVGAGFTILGVTSMRYDRLYGRDPHAWRSEWALAIGLLNLLIAFVLFWFI